MKRDTNKEVVSLRGELRSKYHVWNHSEKGGREHLPRESGPDELDDLKQMLQEEITSIANIRDICVSLIEELEKDWREL